ncbi:MAG: aspartate/glutamate racemase family protein [Candidatus Aminicenantes bacterium]|nr:aspartate/glutamate racemase family protein [Candidatus Aminicenantes bacterium]
MRTIGLLGGMTSESSAEYYKLINTFVREELGGNHSAKSVMVSVDFGEMEPLMEAGEWEKLKSELTETARQIESSGADFLVICTNTIHKFADHIQNSLSIPLLNIIDATAEKIKERGFKTIGLLGTRFTMQEDFYKGRLLEKHGINSVIPTEEERKTIHKIIMDELSIGVINDSSRKKYLEIINNLSEKGAEGVILGCTEIPLLVKSEDCDIPLFDTTTIHARAAVDYALSS